MNCRMVFTQEYEQIELVHDALYAFNLLRCGIERKENVRAVRHIAPGALILRGDDDEFLGGVVWHQLENSLNVFVDYMFVSDKLRGLGWGSKLFQRLEQIVKASGGDEITVTTNSFQAPEFYLKNGYTVIGETPSPQKLFPDNIHYKFSKKL